MFAPNARTSGDARFQTETARARATAPVFVAIVTDDHATAKALADACESMPALDCRVRVAARYDDPADLRPRSGEVLVIDAANAPDRRPDPAHYPDSPCISLVHAPADREDDILLQTHAALLYSDLSPASLAIAVRAAQRNRHAATIARRRIESLERATNVAFEGRRSILEELGPIAHALEGLLDIMVVEPGGPTPTQFGLLRSWTQDFSNALHRHRDAAAVPLAAEADLGAIADDAVASVRAKSDGLGHTVLLSSPPEPVLVAADPKRLRETIRQLLESALDREGSDRRIDVVVWRSMTESHLAIISAPSVRRGIEPVDAPSPPPIRPAGLADSRYMGALAHLRELGAVVETASAASGSRLLISLPAA